MEPEADGIVLDIIHMLYPTNAATKVTTVAITTVVGDEPREIFCASEAIYSYIYFLLELLSGTPQ
jgi:hypothetical protein